MLRRSCLPLAGLALAAGSLAATATAAAAGHAPRAAIAGHLVRPTIHLVRPGGTRPMIAAGIPHTTVTSSNWSGYAAHGHTYRSISASWVEPTGHCHGSGHKYSSFWVGLDGYSSKTVEQTGSEVDCVGSSPRYFAWYEMYPAFPVNFGNRVRPGDHFTGSVTHTSGSSYTLVIRDTTQHWSHTIHKSLRHAKNSSAEVIAEAPSTSAGVLPLADFGTVRFSNAKVNGSAMGRTHPTKIVMTNGSGRDKATVSSLRRGKSFSAIWKRST
jgi:hypothetical protein